MKGYTGDACESCGSTYSPLELKDPVSVVSGTKPTVRESEHLFFRLSAFERELREWVPRRLDEALVRKLDEWFRAGLKDFRRRQSPLVLLFHLTDFAEPLPSARLRGWRQRLFTLSHLSAAHKRARCSAMLDLVGRHFSVTSTAQLLATCTSDSRADVHLHGEARPQENHESAIVRQAGEHR